MLLPPGSLLLTLEASLQADRDDGVSAINCVVEGNAVVGRANPPPGDGPTLQMSKNNSGFVVRQNTCDGRPCP